MPSQDFSIFQHDYFYGPAIELAKDKEKREKALQFISKVSKLGATELILVIHHVNKGVSFNVEKKVSDDLQHTDLRDCAFEEMVWPANSVEFHFEDAKIGSMLIAFMDRATYQGQSISINTDNDKHEYLLVCSAQNKKQETCIAVYTEHTWRTALKEGFIREQQHKLLMDYGMTPEEAKAHMQLTLLCMKVLAYASVPQLKPVPLFPKDMTRRRNDAKPGFKGRPSRPAFRIIDLPTLVRQPKPTQQTAPEGHVRRVFKGRRGHLRYFRSDRFTFKKDTWIYVKRVTIEDCLAASLGGDLKRAYRVRKVG